MTVLRFALATAVLLAASVDAIAQTQKYLPPSWAYYHPLIWNPVDGSTPLVPSVGHSSCASALAQAKQAYAAYVPTIGNLGSPQTMAIRHEGVCTPTAQVVGVAYGYESDQSLSTSGNFSVHAYCEGSDFQGLTWNNAPLQTLMVDGQAVPYCPRPNPPLPKNYGPCNKDGACSIANPVMPGTGMKFQVERDYGGTGPYPLIFERTYNGDAKVGVAAGIGAGWWHTYHRRLAFGVHSSAGPMAVAATRSNGATIGFNLSAGAYVTDGDEVERLEKLPAGGWKLINRDDETELYDDSGRLLSISNRAGLTQTLSYFPSGGPTGDLLQSVTDPFGRVLGIEYTSGRISAVVNPEGGRYTYAYSPTGLEQLVLVTYVNAGGVTRRYHYHNEQNGERPVAGGFQRLLTGITDELGVRYATYGYDTDYFNSQFAGRAISSEHAGGAGKVTISYAGGTSITTHVSATSSATRSYGFQTVQGVARNTTVTGPACPTCGPTAQTFDANGNIASRTDWNGNRTNYTYDLARNLETSRTEALTAAGAATPQTRTISTEWHPTLRLAKRTAEPLRITTNVYNGDGGVTCGMKSDGVTLVPGVLCSKTVQPTSDANGSLGFSAPAAGAPRVWSYTHNANGQVLTMDGPRTDVADTTTYTYYANDDADVTRRGHLATVTNAAGHVTTITAYNAHGQPLSMTDANGLVTTMAYDARQRLTSRTVGTEATGYEYNAAGLLTKVTLPDTSFLAYSYDAAHRLTGLQDNLGNRIAYTLDLAGNRTKEEVFDPANALAQTRSRVYSNLNRLFQEVGAAGQTTEYAYDNQGNVASVKDPLNRITASQYDALNRLRQVTDPASGVTQYAYDGIDQLTQVTDPRSLVTGYTVNGLGNLTQQVNPDTGTTASTYDAAGNLLTQTDAKGQVTTYSYDALNRVAQILFHDGSKQVYAYDLGTSGKGRLSSITERNPADAVTALTEYAYDAHGRVTSETRTVGGQAYATAYRYDASGRMDRITYPSGRTVDTSFDALGRVSQVSTTKDAQTQVLAQNVQYHPFGQAKSWTLGNGQIHARTVDQDGRTASYTLGATNYAIGFDAASRITGINTDTYGYDNLDRLTSAVLASSNFGYSYDAVGNRLSKTVGANTEAYTYSPTSNRIATAGTRSFAFDPNGSTTDDGLNTYAYDVRGRMVQAVSGAGTTSYQVNALGQRIRKTNSTGDTVFHYDTKGRLIAETTAAGAVVREYAYLGDAPLALVKPGTAGGGSEIVVDNTDTGFSVTGTWPASTAVAGFLGANYQAHEPNGVPPGALVVDNTDPGFSVTGSWPNSTAISGFLGSNYQVHAANGEPPSAVVADNTSGTQAGPNAWSASTAVAGYYGSNYQVRPAGTGANTLTWSLSVPSTATYEVYARWTQHPNRATNAKYTVNHAGGSNVVVVNQEAGGGQWNLLGSYSFDAGTATVSLSDDANDYVIADAVMIVPPGAAPPTATWTVAVPSAGTWNVYARWTAHPNRASDAKYTVNHAGGAAQVTVNQEAASGTWNLLGSYSFNAGNATISLTDQANGYVIADAVMLLPPGPSANAAIWTPNVPAAGTYEVYARWTSHSNRASNATYAVTHAGGTTQVPVDQRANGGAWNLLGSFNLDPGTAHKVTLTDAANGYVIADAVRFVPTSVPTAPAHFYVHTDHLNTPRLVADSTGTTVWRWDQQEPFGVNVPDENPSSLGAFEFPLRFPGQYADKESGLHYNYFRDYDASLGRYVKSDPIGLLGGLNTYSYVLGNPISLSDPTGEFVPLLLVPTAVGGAGISAATGVVTTAGALIVAAAARLGTVANSQPAANDCSDDCPARQASLVARYKQILRMVAHGFKMTKAKEEYNRDAKRHNLVCRPYVVDTFVDFIP